MDDERKRQLNELITSMGLGEISIELLNTALTHPSFAHENPGAKLEHNQRLEFLGDAVIGTVVGEYLYRTYPDSPEGELTPKRAVVVCSPTLAEAARRFNLGDYLLLGKGEELSGGRERASLLADAFEAVVGALYLSLDWPGVYRRLIGYLEFALNSQQLSQRGNYKTRLQELVQRLTGQMVSYSVLKESGPAHCKYFTVGVYFQGRELGRGEGSTKKEAEQQAAKAAMEQLDLEAAVRGTKR